MNELTGTYEHRQAEYVTRTYQKWVSWLIREYGVDDALSVARQVLEQQLFSVKVCPSTELLTALYAIVEDGGEHEKIFETLHGYEIDELYELLNARR